MNRNKNQSYIHPLPINTTDRPTTKLHNITEQKTTYFQRTIGSAISYSGITLHTGTSTTVTLRPAEQGTGIRFVRVDLPNRPEIPSTIKHVVDTQRCTVIGDLSGPRIMTVEHILSALAGMRIDNVWIEVSGEEIPVGDGSSAVFCELIEQGGVVEQHVTRRYLSILRPIWVNHGRSYMVALPSDRFKISLTLTNDHQHPALCDEFMEIDLDQDIYRAQIAPARTFGYMSEVEMLKSQGLIQGATLLNTVVIGETEILTPLRFEKEMVRHKILDLIGDLALLGPIKTHLFGVRPSHRLNHKLALAILADFENNELRFD